MRTQCNYERRSDAEFRVVREHDDDHKKKSDDNATVDDTMEIGDEKVDRRCIAMDDQGQE